MSCCYASILIFKKDSRICFYFIFTFNTTLLINNMLEHRENAILYKENQHLGYTRTRSYVSIIETFGFACDRTRLTLSWCLQHPTTRFYNIHLHLTAMQYITIIRATPRWSATWVWTTLRWRDLLTAKKAFLNFFR